MPGKALLIEQALSQAKALEKAGELAQAEHMYRTLLTQYPMNRQVMNHLKSVQQARALQGQPPATSLSLQAGTDALIDLYKHGRFAEALKLGEGLAGQYRGDPTLPNILGVINARMGHSGSALACYDRALALKPDFAEAYNNRGNVLNRLGQHDEAIASFRKAIEIKPEYAEAHNNMGVALYDAGAVAEAVTSYREALRIRPGYAEAHNNLGNVFRDLDKPEEASASFATALRINPGFAQAHKNMGDTLRSLGKLDMAINCYQKAIQIMPDYSEPHLGLGLILNDLGRHRDAIDSIKTAIRLKPGSAEAHTSLGGAQGHLGLYQEAIASYVTALEIRPAFAEAHCSLGIALAEIGRHEDAIVSFNKALQLRPDLAEAHINLARIKNYISGDPQIEKMLERMAKPDITDNERVHLNFALGKVYEDLGDHDQSFNYLLAGNKIRKAASQYDINVDKAAFRKIKSVFKAGNSFKCAKESLGGMFPRLPIFIVGMPRSGTTLAEQILASHSKVFGGGELENLGRVLGPAMQEMIMNGQERMSSEAMVGYRDSYLRDLAARPGNTPFITDKMPINFKWIGFLQTVMPGVKIIHMQRDPVATCWSMFKMQFRGSGYTNDLVDIAEYYRLYLDLMGYWREEFPGQIYDLDYEVLTHNQEQETRKLLEYCGLDWEEQCLEFYKTERAVRTLSDKQVRQKMYTGSSEAWRKYEKHLGPMLEVLNRQE